MVWIIGEKLITANYHDYPYEDRPFRCYLAITTDCNRSCPWCSTYSNPGKVSYMSRETFLNLIPKSGIFEVQFEGGEPTLHPDLDRMIKKCRRTGRCHKVVISTNGVLFPFKYKNNKVDVKNSSKFLKDYFSIFEAPLTIKLSLNHHLYEYDKLIFEKAKILVNIFKDLQSIGDFKIIFNVRLRKNPIYNNDVEIKKLISKYSLEPYSNIFFIQAYGRNSHDKFSEKPFLVGFNFELFNPDGKSYGTNLIKRAEAMNKLP